MTVPPLAAKSLERALLFTFVMHGVAMLTMVGFLLPGMPGGPHLSVIDRAAYLAAHPWLWRLGWLAWQLTALSDLLLAVALLITPWISKPAAVFTLVVTILALIPDQYGQAMWTWHGVDLAQKNVAAYADFESHIFRLIAGYGTIGYLAGALGWTWCFAAAGTWNHRLTQLSFATWGVFSLSTVLVFVPPSMHPPAYITSAGNAIGFILLMIWFIAVTEQVLRHSRVGSTTWRYPCDGFIPRAIDLIANSQFVRYVGEHVHAFAMSSDIVNVVFINYLVPAKTLESLVPPGLILHRVGPNADHAVYSILTYRHGHFGPTFFGRFRRIWPSPIQSNWRIYVTDPTTKYDGVHFTTTAITSLPHALVTRMLSQGVPMHVPLAADVHRDDDGKLHIHIDPGTGSAPDLHGTFSSADQTDLSPHWKTCFASWTEMLNHIVPQDRALAPQSWYGRMARQEITLGIALQDCVPVIGQIHSSAAQAIVGNAEPLCFKIDHVHFRFVGEVFDKGNRT